MRTDNLNIFHDTMEILQKGYYGQNQQKVPLKLTSEEMQKIQVFLPEEIKELAARPCEKKLSGGNPEESASKENASKENVFSANPSPEKKKTSVTCINCDSFTWARTRAAEIASENAIPTGLTSENATPSGLASENAISSGFASENATPSGLASENATPSGLASASVAINLTNAKKPVLVLNLANPVNPGGGVRRGARAQEEDLCRKSSLLLSLESQSAKRYYDYNKSLNTYMGSDAVMITPQVEIIKDEKGDLLEDSVIVSVMTCAAPCLSFGREGMTERQYQKMVYDRITGMLTVAAAQGYEHLVLGAFGCGAFDNDAVTVSRLFDLAMQSFRYQGHSLDDCFRTIDFAVMDHSRSQYNYQAFASHFGN